MPRITETLKTDINIAADLISDGSHGAGAIMIQLTVARALVEIAETLNEIKTQLAAQPTPEPVITTATAPKTRTAKK